MIELVNLVKKFGDLVAVNDISLTVGRGEFFAVLGPNAAGKTTALKILAGLMKPTAGTARVCGFDIQMQPLEARARLAYVPDFPFKAGITVSVSTHQLSVAEEMAGRIGIIQGGRFVAVGTRDGLRQLSGGAGPLEDIFLTLTAGEVGAVEKSGAAPAQSG